MTLNKTNKFVFEFFFLSFFLSLTFLPSDQTQISKFGFSFFFFLFFLFAQSFRKGNGWKKKKEMKRI